MVDDVSSGSVGVDLDEVSSVDRNCILIVDDDPDTVTLLKQILRKAGYDVISAADGDEALEKCVEVIPDLVLLDIMMPDMDGRETLQLIQEVTDVPVIFVSAIDGKDDIVQSLLDGGDDYITKPFYNDEVVARIKTVLRRAGPKKEITRYIFHKVGLIIDLMTKEVILDDSKIQLTHKEFELLNLLARSAPNVVPYREITTSIWGEETSDARKRAKYLIYLLRTKFRKIKPDSKLIINVDRLGYKLQTE